MNKTACKDCGVIIDIEKFNETLQYSCPRCHTVFYRPGQSFDLVLVMAITALLFFIPATFLPIMTLEILGQIHSVTLFEAVWFFVNDGYIIIALIAAASGVVIPVVLLILILMMIIPLKNGASPKSVRALFRTYEHLTGWAMAEVYLVSIFVAIIKLGGMAELTLDFGLYSFAFFLVVFYITLMWFNPDDLWNRR
jgi:paraquat-inducible protein A